tara:strand:+ start:401 stop:895 length:495 start_codon:yes stop_codon:yes gene_type:complete
MIYTIINSDNAVVNPLIKCDTDPSFLLKDGETAISQSISNRFPEPRRGCLYHANSDSFVRPMFFIVSSTEVDNDNRPAIKNGEVEIVFSLDREASPNIQESDFSITSASISNFTANNWSGSFTLTTASVVNLNSNLILSLNPTTFTDSKSLTYTLSHNEPLQVV